MKKNLATIIKKTWIELKQQEKQLSTNLFEEKEIFENMVKRKKDKNKSYDRWHNFYRKAKSEKMHISIENQTIIYKLLSKWYMVLKRIEKKLNEVNLTIRRTQTKTVEQFQREVMEHHTKLPLPDQNKEIIKKQKQLIKCMTNKSKVNELKNIGEEFDKEHKLARKTSRQIRKTLKKENIGDMKITKIREKNNMEELTNIFENQNKLVQSLGKLETDKIIQKNTCSQCKKEFTTNVARKRHERETHKEKVEKMICECGYATKRKFDLKRHKESKHAEKLSTCEVCGKFFRWKQSLIRHIKQHK